MRFKRFIFRSVLLAVTLPLLTACNPIHGRTEAYSKSFFAMDTYMTFTVYDDNAEDARAALACAQEEIDALEALIAVTDAQSDIYSVNHGGDSRWPYGRGRPNCFPLH